MRGFRGFKRTIAVSAVLTAFPLVLGNSSLPAKMLTPADHFVGPLSYDPFEYIVLDKEHRETLMLISAVHDPRSESRAFFHRIEIGSEENSAPMLISEPGRSVSGAQLRMGGNGRLHAAWLKLVPKRQNWIYYRYSDDRGRSWSEPKSFIAGFSPREPALRVLDDSTVVLGTSSSAERPSKGERIYLWVSADNGLTWQEKDINFADRRGSTTGLRLVAAPDRTVLAVWVDMSDEGTRIVGNLSRDRGQSWLDEPVLISDDPQRRVADFRLFSDESSFSAGWLAGGPHNHQLMFDRSDLSGTGWGEDRVLSAPRVDRVDYEIVLASDRMYYIWTESQGYGRFVRETLKVQGFAYPSLEEVLPETIVYDAGEVGQTVIGFDLAVYKGGVPYISAITHSMSGGWYVAVWKLDAETGATSLVWEDRAGMSREVTTAALKASDKRLLLLTREARARRLPQQNVFNGSIFLRTIEGAIE